MILGKTSRNYCGRYVISANDIGGVFEREEWKERWMKTCPFDAPDNTEEIQRVFRGGRMARSTGDVRGGDAR